jgi:AcrR family transcriptional regulator
VDDKRQRILGAARERFRHYGVRKTAMHEIAKDAGVAVGTLYLYFKDKDDLLVACTEEYVTRHRRVADAILVSNASAANKLRRYVLDRYRAAKSTRAGGHRPAAELLHEVLRVRPERRLEEAQMMAEHFVRILRTGMETGELHSDDPERDARVLLFSLAFLFPSAADAHAYSPNEADALLVIDWFLNVWRESAANHATQSTGRVSHQGKPAKRKTRT